MDKGITTTLSVLTSDILKDAFRVREIPCYPLIIHIHGQAVLVHATPRY